MLRHSDGWEEVGKGNRKPVPVSTAWVGILGMLRKSPDHTSTAFVGYSVDSAHCHLVGSHHNVEDGEVVVVEVEVLVMVTSAGTHLGKTLENVVGSIREKMAQSSRNRLGDVQKTCA